MRLAVKADRLEKMSKQIDTEISLYDKFKHELREISFLKNSVASIDMLTEQFGDEHSGLAEEVLSIAKTLGWDTQEIFAGFVIDYLKEQLAFEEKGEYGHYDFDKIRHDILDNVEVMRTLYLPGIFLCYPMTAILYHKYSFFIRNFIRRITADMVGTEVGYGDGFYLWVMLKNVPGLRLSGFDISPSAKVFSEELLAVANIESDRFDLHLGNVLEGLPIDERSLDWVILAEIIEHLPNPADAIIEMGKKLKPGGWLYVATMIDSNHMDHISNFESPDVVASLMTDQDFTIEDALVYRVTDDFPESTDRSVSVAFIARKN